MAYIDALDQNDVLTTSSEENAEQIETCQNIEGALSRIETLIGILNFLDVWSECQAVRLVRWPRYCKSTRPKHTLIAVVENQ